MIQRKHISLGLHFSGNIHVNNRPSTDLNKVLQRNGRVKVKEDEFIPSSENMKKKEISIKIASLGWLCEYAVQILSMKVLWTRRRTSTSLVKMIMASNWPWRLVHPLLVPWVTVRAHKTPHYNRHLWRLFKIKIKFHMDVISHNNIASFHWLTHKASIAFYSFIEGACMHRRADRFFKMSKFLISYVRQFHGYGWIRILVPHIPHAETIEPSIVELR